MILITGATGILGRVILLELLKRGKNVRACKRSGSDLSDVRQSYHFYTQNADFYFDKIEWVNVDFNDRQSLYNALEDVTEVYHCAAKVSFDPDDYEEVLETGIISTRNLLNICRGLPVKKFLFVSSSAVMHVNKSDIELQIKSENNFKKYPAYVISKYICEKLVKNADNKGLRTVIINPGMIIGSGNWKKEKSQLADFFLKSKFTFSGGTSCIDVRDVATTAISLMEENRFGEKVCVSSENALYKDIATQIRILMGKKKPIICSKTFLKTIKPLRLFLRLIDDKANFLTDENIEFISCKQYEDNSKLKETIKQDFYSVPESIKFHYGNYLAYQSMISAHK